MLARTWYRYLGLPPLVAEIDTERQEATGFSKLDPLVPTEFVEHETVPKMFHQGQAHCLARGQWTLTED